MYKYRITRTGRIINKKSGRELKPETTKNGYIRYTLTIDGKLKHFLAHRLVAETYIPNPENKPFINHKNGIKIDNCVENLEWCTSKENHFHAILNKLRNPVGANNGRSKLTEKEVLEIRSKYIYRKYSYNRLAKEYNVTSTLIRYIIIRKLWKHLLST